MNDRRDERPGLKQHPTDVLSLVFGLVFVGVTAWWLMDVVTGGALRLGWVIAGSLIAIGGIGLVAAVRPQRRARNHPPTD